MKISTSSLSKTFHDADRELTIIESLSFEFPSSGSVAILGRSGIGKSTLLHMLGGLERPSSGSIKFDGIDLFALPDKQLSAFRGGNIGYIFQSHHLLPEFNALENVAMPLIIAGRAEAEALSEAQGVLQRVGLGDRLDHRPGALSGGEQQRVAIARAVVTNPKVVLADEPTGSLDFAMAKQVQELLLEIQKDLQSVMIIVTHNLDLARDMDHLYEMQPGGGLKDLKS